MFFGLVFLVLNVKECMDAVVSSSFFFPACFCRFTLYTGGFRRQGQDPGAGSRGRIQGQDPGAGSRGRIQGQDPGARTSWATLQSQNNPFDKFSK